MTHEYDVCIVVLLIAMLTTVDGISRSDWSSQENTLDECGG